ncbi:MAG: HIT family protein [Candidatus Aenigmarchaeota archaeon]|nr:HIT family protein [Candidatus Aenigmarchaeota archaeon]MDI6722125.1 HIT family protein [Candidatus Aenigmarchaeota archaeon]
MDCLFCKIVKKEIPARVVYNDSDTIAFLDINPANPGHVLVVPKKHHEMIMDADDDMLKKSVLVVRELSKKIMEEMKADGINVVQNNGKHAGQLVPHVHFHIIPRFPEDMVVISYKRSQIEDKKMDEIRKKLETKPLHFEEVHHKKHDEEENKPKKEAVPADKWVDL